MKNEKFYRTNEGEEMKVSEPVAVYDMTATVDERIAERLGWKSTSHLDKAIAAAKDSPLFEVDNIDDLMKTLKE